MNHEERKKIRLPEDCYKGGDTFLVTICTKDKSPIFSSDVNAMICMECAKSISEGTGTQLYATCIMPDHVHLLVACKAGFSLSKFVALFKSETTKSINKFNNEIKVWQRRYHDHGLGSYQDTVEAARYILENPVRKGLVKEWHQWKHSWCMDEVLR